MSNLSKKLITIFMLSSILFTGGLFYSSTPATVYAAINPSKTACDGIKAAGGECDSGDTGLRTTIKGIINVLLYVVGVAAVIMMVVGAIRFVTSAGNQQAAAAARQTILYALVGIIVAALSFAAVNYVFKEVASPDSSSSETTEDGTPVNPPGGGQDYTPE